MAGGHGRRKKRRVAAPQDEENARRTFLEALEAQRAKARNESGEKPAETGAPKAAAPPLPGFHYDEAKRRYFRSSEATERLQREQVETQKLQQLQAEKEASMAQIRRGRGRKSQNWVNYLMTRQSDWSWSARARDQRALMPQLLSGFLSNQVVEAQDLQSQGKLTALALHPAANNVGAVGSSAGTLHLLGTNGLSSQDETESSSQHISPIISFQLGTVITSVEWRPVQELDLLVSQLGNAQGGNGRQRGSVTYIGVGERETSGLAMVDASRLRKWSFIDPWIAKWSVRHPNKFSIGGGGTWKATYVDALGLPNAFQRAPMGAITSDVHAQSFSSTGDILLNGTKDGALWGWDLRSPQRAFEYETEADSSRPASSVVDLHMLSDCYRAVVQRSSGELCLLDLRTFKPVVEFMPGAHKQYVPSLRCAVDSYEAVVVAGGDIHHPQAVNSYNLQNGQRIASLEVKDARGLNRKRGVLVQQVQLKRGNNNTRYADTPEIWALTRNELYICGGWTNDPI